MQPKPDDLPTEFAIFPLTGALLLPGGKLPLNIFEPRYLAMVDDQLAGGRHGRVIGMIQPDASSPATPTGPGLYRIGCLGRLASFSETDDGRYLITLAGLVRFAVAAELDPRHGYRRIRADLARFAADMTPASETPALLRADLLAALRAYFTAQGLSANWDAIETLADAALVDTLAMICPFHPAEKQALLEAETLQDRAGILLQLLQIGAHPAPQTRTS